ncbi:hypothetical protein PLICRDRAFT_697035 [Plicaturopsis crispa FD-325 SS-3]|nr:hypothetical protein PLICRDRAFT_697035 [Plicaturopsis crispa FD-325 SS-3]
MSDYRNDETLARSIVLYNYMKLAPITILYFDMILTFVDEVNFIWRRPKSVSSVLFLINRYLSAASNAAILAFTNRTLSTESCKTFYTAQQNVLILTQIFVGALMIIRTYALYARSKRILVSLIGLSAILIAITVWATSTVTGDITIVSGFGGCYDVDRAYLAARFAISWEALFAFDLTIFVLTAWKTYVKGRSIQYLSGRMSLTTVILRDGAAYFAVMVLVNFANMLTYYLNSTSDVRGLLSTFVSCLAVTMVSRLMLNLHKSAHNGIFSNNTTETVFTTAISDYSVRMPVIQDRQRTTGHTGISVTTPTRRTRDGFSPASVQEFQVDLPERARWKSRPSVDYA